MQEVAAQHPANAGGKKPYTRPDLIEYGTLTELIHGSGDTVTEVGNYKFYQAVPTMLG